MIFHDIYILKIIFFVFILKVTTKIIYATGREINFLKVLRPEKKEEELNDNEEENRKEEKV